MIASKSEKKDNCEAFRVTCKHNKFCFEKFVLLIPIVLGIRTKKNDT